ncbi:sensor histidine kinase [Intrasporangium calvum]|uniref:histidine kinase n=1 Tax=Intrasporangium calvum (strain ATCC 23552 / DSM 43043 / JCM 3097 / NBRC 12989 / NCIMB 10167 / NRRL B-3866 / 7 KIP) TaxID=710696 RepID=E6SE22_INTC7|nr:HAMP domain-containing sensor histidine kinase [Intrasporangium calvum]ADU47635.1 integral membrane sensor signal transduction histidine kinase [Intrasporangium calvum DSM 43043]
MKRFARLRPLSLRTTITLSFASLALVVSAILAGGTYLAAREFLIGQREQTAAQQAFASASMVRDGLRTRGSDVIEVLASVPGSSGSVVLVKRQERWYSSSLNVAEDAIAPEVRQVVRSGLAGVAWSRLDGRPVIVVGVPLPAVEANFYQIASASELDSTLTTLGSVLAAFAALTTIGGTLMSRAAAARAIAPLESVATAAARIAAGQMDTRLGATEDPDLSVIVGSFNTMVEALEERVQRDARFAADVSHELRSPVTTLMTSVDVLAGSRNELPLRAQRAVELVEGEVDRLRRALEHLLELGRLDAGTAHRDVVDVDLRDLVAHALSENHRATELLSVPTQPVRVLADKQELNRALVNLFDNADLHGGGLSAVNVTTSNGRALIRVDDAGPGVPEADRELIFERFARSGSRGSRQGTGLGLSLVEETARAHGGSVWCEDRAEGGARFTLALPLSEEGE